MDEIENDAPIDVPHGQRKFNRRKTKACARCRKRKAKRDFKLPACSACEAVSAFPCMGYNVTLGKTVPRSVVSFLETRVAELELQLEKQKLSNASLAAINSTKYSRAPVEVLCTASALSAALCDVMVPRDQYSYTRSI
jgi:ribosomal protein L37AE/L43A